MAKRIACILLAVLACTLLVFYRVARTASKGLHKAPLIALVAGDVLPEIVVQHIRSEGLTFAPDASYKALLQNAGADDKVLNALESAKSPFLDTLGTFENPDILKHLSNAGKFIRGKDFDAANNEVNAILSTGLAKPEADFVMGTVFIKQKQWDRVAQTYADVLRTAPDFPEIHTRMGLAYVNTGDYESSARESRASIALDPDNPTAHMNLAVALIQLGDFVTAKSEIQTAIRCKPDYALAFENLAVVLTDLHDSDGSIEARKNALALDPDNAQGHYTLGCMYGEKNQFDLAIQEYREAKRLDPDMLEARQNLGATLMHTDPNAAITEFLELQALAPDWPFCHRCLAEAYSLTGHPEDARREYKLATSDPNQPE